MGPQIKNRKVRIALYVVIMLLMVGHLAFFSKGIWLFRVIDLAVTLMAGIRLWMELHDDD